ncbi:MAG: RdgB/HAM1 family non-canonical purine NTP pyrophosphatase, partial [Bacteroidales bacterium]|nr:RdgB/HAM1 family non-canonical purine NTP pyrophosphatase [Bacteroidales bacterium]
YDKYKKDCFADDTGLEVKALDGRPGVYSARYAGEKCSFDDNIDKLLEEMDGKTNRKARFLTVICLIENGKERYFEGECKGVITAERYGKKGFGYDPVFIPDGHAESFAEMSGEDKNKISHRGIATRKLIDYLLKR